jgi:hypothetical protein
MGKENEMVSVENEWQTVYSNTCYAKWVVSADAIVWVAGFAEYFMKLKGEIDKIPDFPYNVEVLW